ncbi:unnamed protein product [Nezara viridula]|uniref:EF-hand domain-containing protein n=1 Tax=Nezara viridula TaxID=85310 RepID=A0A9P0H967_NEZVI|nr:unnamed protein product [Nezara viridula]
MRSFGVEPTASSITVEEERKAREQLDHVFRKLDINQDGVITLEEFIESCLKIERRVEIEKRCEGSFKRQMFRRGADIGNTMIKELGGGRNEWSGSIIEKRVLEGGKYYGGGMDRVL